MRPGSLAALIGIASLMGSVDSSKHRRQHAPQRTKQQAAYRRAANARRKFALAPKRRNRRSR